MRRNGGFTLLEVCSMLLPPSTVTNHSQSILIRLHVCNNNTDHIENISEHALCISYNTPSSDMVCIYNVPAISRRGGVMSDL